MKPLRLRIADAARQHHISQPVIEKDYTISYLLASIASVPALSDTLVLKGGTALKKLFFGDYRFSEDLDFSAQDAPQGQELEHTFRAVVDEAARLLSEHGPFAVELERYLEREPHPHGQEAFTMRVQFPWHPRPLCRVRAEITHDEPVLLAPQKRALIHGYDEEDLQAHLCCYQLEELVAEKLRTLLQTHEKLIRRGWTRPHARDYYDLWRTLDAFGDTLERQQFRPLLERKCKHRGVKFLGLDDFFSGALVEEACLRWDANLRPFVVELPECQEVLDRLKRLLQELF